MFVYTNAIIHLCFDFQHDTPLYYSYFLGHLYTVAIETTRVVTDATVNKLPLYCFMKLLLKSQVLTADRNKNTHCQNSYNTHVNQFGRGSDKNTVFLEARQGRTQITFTLFLKSVCLSSWLAGLYSHSHPHSYFFLEEWILYGVKFIWWLTHVRVRLFPYFPEKHFWPIHNDSCLSCYAGSKADILYCWGKSISYPRENALVNRVMLKYSSCNSTFPTSTSAFFLGFNNCPTVWYIYDFHTLFI